jgi:hypothetical protein
MDESLAVILPVSTGGTQRFVLGTFHFQQKKVDDNNWKLMNPAL